MDTMEVNKIINVFLATVDAVCVQDQEILLVQLVKLMI
jgi:hypothetical protein